MKIPYLLMATVIALSLAACGGGGGGEGADFDSSLYYTKTEVNNMIASLATEAEVDDIAADVVQIAAETADNLSAVGWAGKMSFTPPTGAQGVLLKIAGYNNTAEAKTYKIMFSAVEGANSTNEAAIFTASAMRYFVAYGYAPVTAATMYAWHDSAAAVGVYTQTFTDCAPRVSTVLWFQ